jgi:glycosyltransferase involved in cell wall biosynthesis
LSAIAYLHGLLKAGVPLSWTPLFQGPGGYVPAPSSGQAVRRLGQLALPVETADLYDSVGASGGGDVCLLHTIPELWSGNRQPHGHHVGYTVWETTAVPPHWPDLLASVDQLLTPSRVSAEVFAAAGVRVPIDIVPHVCRQASPLANGARFREEHAVPPDHTLFYTINAWTARKAVWSTLHAYCAAFTARDTTTLVVKTDAVGPAREGDGLRHPVQKLVNDLVSNYPDAPHVCLIVRALPQAEMDDLHAAGDCYVSLTRAEGWGLGAFDGACAGKPVVMTGWGGQLDYLSSDDAFLLDYELVPVRDRLGGGSYRRDQRWAQANLDDAVERLRWVHEHRAEASAMGARLGARLREEFASDAVIARLAGILDV